MRFLVNLLCVITLFGCQDKSTQSTNVNRKVPKAIYPSYDQFKSNISRQRQCFAAADRVTNEQIAEYWFEAFSDTLPHYWEGTKWDYNGTTEVPKLGSIACGYFVTTVLRDMGLQVNRIKLAVCPSLEMMKSVAADEKVDNFSSVAVDEMERQLVKRGKGVFIIGLDYHTGFLISDGSKLSFLHSNYIYKIGVVKESAISSTALAASKTKFVVCLTRSQKVRSNWLRTVDHQRAT